jgi:hypothetical protein
VPKALCEFINDDSIVFFGAAIGNDIEKLGMNISATIDL